MKRSAAPRAVRVPARLRRMAVGALLLASCATTPGGELTAPLEPHPAPPASPNSPDAKHLACPDVAGRAGDAAGAPRVARWGMTVDEVLSAFPGEAVRPSAAEGRQGEGPVRIACEIGGTTFQASFLFDKDARLRQITLDPSSKRDAGRPLFDRLAKLLTARYGQPVAQHDDLALIGPLRQSDRSWKSADADVALVHMYGTDDPFLHLVYDPPRRPDAKK